MNLFFRLLSLRIQSVFKGSGKKAGDKKGIGFKIFVGAMIAYAAICFIIIFGVYFARMAKSFVEAENGFAYFSMVAVIMISIGFVTTVFAAQSQIFEAKDNDLLTSMPIPVRYILLTRIITLLLIEMIESIIIGGEAIIVYSLYAKVPLLGYMNMIVEIIGLNLITASISSIFGLILASITVRVHRKSLVTTIATLAIAAGFFEIINYGQKYLNSLLDNFDTNNITIDVALKRDMYPFYCFGQGVEQGSFMYMIIFLGISVGIFTAVIFLLSPFFLKITAAKKGTLRKKFKPENNRKRSIRSTLLHKEIKRFFSNASYMLNTGMGLIVLLGGAVALIIEKEKLFDVITDFSYMKQHIGMYVIFVELFFCAINVISAPSLSLEGESLWICKSMPVEPKDILFAKAKSHIIICMPCIIIFGIAANIALPIDLPMRIAVFVIPAGATIFTGLLGVIDNLMLPKFDWSDEGVAVKQSLAVVATMGIGFAVVIISFIAYAFVHFLPYADLIFTFLFMIAYLIAILLMIRYLKKGGSRKFLML